MCLAIPAKVIKKESERAKVDYGGIEKEISCSLVDAKPGDWVIVHAGFAIQRISKEEAAHTIQELRNL